MHAISKHVESDVHYIRDHVSQNEITMAYVPSADQITNCLTKPLTQTRFNIKRQIWSDSCTISEGVLEKGLSHNPLIHARPLLPMILSLIYDKTLMQLFYYVINVRIIVGSNRSILMYI